MSSPRIDPAKIREGMRDKDIVPAKITGDIVVPVRVPAQPEIPPDPAAKVPMAPEPKGVSMGARVWSDTCAICSHDLNDLSGCAHVRPRAHPEVLCREPTYRCLN